MLLIVNIFLLFAGLVQKSPSKMAQTETRGTRAPAQNARRNVWWRNDKVYGIRSLSIRPGCPVVNDAIVFVQQRCR